MAYLNYHCLCRYLNHCSSIPISFLHSLEISYFLPLTQSLCCLSINPFILLFIYISLFVCLYFYSLSLSHMIFCSFVHFFLFYYSRYPYTYMYSKIRTSDCYSELILIAFSLSNMFVSATYEHTHSFIVFYI